MKKHWKKQGAGHKSRVLMAGSCIVLMLMIGIVSYVSYPKEKQEDEKTNAVSQMAKEQTEEENTAMEQEDTKAVATGIPETTPKETENTVTEKNSIKAEEIREEETKAGQNKGKGNEDSINTTMSAEKEKNAKTEQSKEKQKSSEEKEQVSQTPKQNIAETEKDDYVPISEGWKDAKSAKGEITSAQKQELDAMVETWKSGVVSDAELKTNIMEYLKVQEIKYTEVSVTSQGYALYDEVPKIELHDGGNLYSFVGTYSTGKQNPDGTDKTVFYNWSVFVF